MRISVEDQPSKQDLESLDQGIIDYNISTAGMTWQPLTVLLRNDSGRVAGGLIGQTEWGWLYVKLLYIEDQYRGQGYGTQLLMTAEEQAISRGCKYAHLDTFGFQAPGFYPKFGYEVFGVLENYPPGYSRYYLKKMLRP